MVQGQSSEPKSTKERVQKWRLRQKQRAIDYKGGKCSACGYNKCPDALDFHHLDPTEKEFGLASSGITRAWERVKKELDKCILLCANCHRELHYQLNRQIPL